MVSAKGYGFFDGCAFNGVSRPPSYNPTNYFASTQAIPILFEAPANNWKVTKCRFTPFATPTMVSNSEQIQINSGPTEIIITENHFDANPFGGSNYLVDCIIMSGPSANYLGNQVIHSNTGGGQLAEAGAVPSRAVDASATMMSVVLPYPLPSAQYQVDVEFVVNLGPWWITNKTVNGFAINWTVNAPATGTTLNWWIRR